ncbi:hypothetical protein [Paenibacillus illinoisensis]|uniref:hypothetical protein n=1 Tax=Paenibacillus illinoisensis TaxID=59845 RepID=UPI00301CADA8
MYIRWTLVTDLFFTNYEPFELGPICFKYKDYSCELSFEIEHTGTLKDITVYSKVKSVDFFLRNDDYAKLENLFNNNAKIFKEMIAVSNIFLKAVRVIGRCPRVHEISYKKEEEDIFFERFDLRFSHDGSDEVSKINHKIFYHPSSKGYNDTIDFLLWKWEVVKYIGYKVDIAAEKEFSINAIEQFQLFNNRIAVLEATIGLEIALNNYLKSYFKNHKGLSDSRIKNFLGPEIGLMARVSAMLSLTINDESLSKIDVDKVLLLIGWRNKIVHTNGNIPEGVPDVLILESLNHTLNLIQLLSNKRRYVETGKELRMGNFISLP